MNITRHTRNLALIVCAIGLLAGCAGGATKEAAPKATAAAAPAGPSPEAQAAIDAARAAVKDATAIGGVWRDTEDMIKSAEEAAKGGDNDKAIKLAKTAKQEAEVGANQAYLERAKFEIDQAKARKKLTAEQKATVDAAWDAVTKHEGKKAYDLISKI